MPLNRRLWLRYAAMAVGFRLAGRRAGWAAPGPLSREEQERFLRTAAIWKVEDAGAGVTGSKRVLLSDGYRSHYAHWQSVDRFHPKLETASGTERNLHDSYRFNIAAYRLDKLLDLGMVPVAVERTIQRRRSALSWWVDDVLMTEMERQKKNLFAPDFRMWREQEYVRRIFDELIANADRNQGNILIDKGWRIWLIDHTRAFRTRSNLRSTAALVRCDRKLLATLKALTAEGVEAGCQPHLSRNQLRDLLRRRDQLVQHFGDLIARLGEPHVLFDLSATR
jgi:hypothetical protein